MRQSLGRWILQALPLFDPSNAPHYPVKSHSCRRYASTLAPSNVAFFVIFHQTIRNRFRLQSHQQSLVRLVLSNLGKVHSRHVAQALRQIECEHRLQSLFLRHILINQADYFRLQADEGGSQRRDQMGLRRR